MEILNPTDIADKENPTWNQEFILSVPKETCDALQFRICDSQGQLIGETELSLHKHEELGFHDEWLPLKQKDVNRGEIHTSCCIKSPNQRPKSASASAVQRNCNLICPQPRYVDPTIPFKKMFMLEEGWSNWDARSLLVDKPPTR